jgi:diaminopimelate epimerase
VLNALTVDIGNPHLVLLQADDRLPRTWEVQNDVLQLERTFPSGVNIELVARGPEEGAVSMIVHERGAGWTQACGTGSCAVAYAARLAGWVGDTVVVHNPGGAVTVDLDGESARLTGPAVHIADLTVEEVR